MRDIPVLLRERGLKVTPQRIAIYTVMMNTKAHPSAESIYKALETDNPTMSLATVYKTLDSFKNAGLVMELNMGEGYARYDAETKCHPHVVCRCCHRVDDLEIDGFDNIRCQIMDQTDYVLESEQLIFYGICAQCAKDNL